MTKKLTGWTLFEALFGEEVDSIWEIEDRDDVSDYKDSILYNEDWYNHHEVTFEKNGRTYRFTYKDHSSDNVCDTTINYDSFALVHGKQTSMEVGSLKEADAVFELLESLVNNGNKLRVTITEKV